MSRARTATKKSASLPLLIKNFLMDSGTKKFSFPRMQNRQFIFEPKKQYVLTAEQSKAGVSNLQLPK